MRYRALDSNGDYTIGLPFLFNSPQCVAQAISTRLKLWQGEWFLDNTEGMPWAQKVLGKSTNPNAYIKQNILGTEGVVALTSYSSTYVGGSRTFTVSGTVETLYGQTNFSVNVSIPLL